MSLDPRSPHRRRIASTIGTAPESDAVAVGDAVDILARIQVFAGDKDKARDWYCGQPLPALGARTAEALVKMGQGAAVRDYLDTLSIGGFA